MVGAENKLLLTLYWLSIMFHGSQDPFRCFLVPFRMMSTCYFIDDCCDSLSTQLKLQLKQSFDIANFSLIAKPLISKSLFAEKLFLQTFQCLNSRRFWISTIISFNFCQKLTRISHVSFTSARVGFFQNWFRNSVYFLRLFRVWTFY